MSRPRREKWSRPGFEVSANDWSLQSRVDVFPLAQKHNGSDRFVCHRSHFTAERKFKVYEYQER